MSVKEGNLLKKIMLQHTPLGRLFRVNCGSGWIGKSKRLPNGDVLIKDARRFSTGLPKGTPDLIGFTTIEITKGMVGEFIAVFTCIEGKTGKLKLTTEQRDFLNMVIEHDGIATVSYKEEEVLTAINNFTKEKSDIEKFYPGEI